MSWQDRLRESIKLVSPDGNIFEPNWIGNSATMEKKIGLFDYPKVKGTLTQDLGVTSPIYPLTLYFEGADNDIESAAFFRALKETGTWEVTHPVLGLLILQPLSFSPNIMPVESGNLTQVDTEWIEPISEDTQISTPELASSITNSSDVLNTTGSEQFVNNVVQDSSAQTFAVKTTAEKVVSFTVTNLKPLYEKVPEINAQIIAITRSIQNTIDQTAINTLSLAGQIQNLIELPILASNDIASRLSSYTGMILDVLGLSPDLPTIENKNVVAVQELTLTAVIVSLAQISSHGTLSTRPKAIEAAENVSDKFIQITDGLDVSQELFINNDIDLQYFSQSSSFPDASIITAEAIAYLLLASFELAIEKRFILEKPRAPIEIAITEGVDVDLFLESNQLKRNDIILLPAGRGVVVYV